MSGVSANPVLGSSSAQLLTINGSSFVSGATLTSVTVATARNAKGQRPLLLKNGHNELLLWTTPKKFGLPEGIAFSGIHPWGQEDAPSSALRCVVAVGGLSSDHECWKGRLPGFFLPAKVLSLLLERLFLEAIKLAFQQNELQFFGGRRALISLIWPS